MIHTEFFLKKVSYENYALQINRNKFWPHFSARMYNKRNINNYKYKFLNVYTHKSCFFILENVFVKKNHKYFMEKSQVIHVYQFKKNSCIMISNNLLKLRFRFTFSFFLYLKSLYWYIAILFITQSIYFIISLLFR